METTQKFCFLTPQPGLMPSPSSPDGGMFSVFTSLFSLFLPGSSGVLIGVWQPVPLGENCTNQEP